MQDFTIRLNYFADDDGHGFTRLHRKRNLRDD